jgi:hypothetical protein
MFSVIDRYPEEYSFLAQSCEFQSARLFHFARTLNAAPLHAMNVPETCQIGFPKLMLTGAESYSLLPSPSAGLIR